MWNKLFSFYVCLEQKIKIVKTYSIDLTPGPFLLQEILGKKSYQLPRQQSAIQSCQAIAGPKHLRPSLQTRLAMKSWTVFPV